MPHCRRPRSVHRLLLSQYLPCSGPGPAPLFQFLQCSRPRHLPTDRVPSSVPPLAPPTARAPAPSQPGPSSLADPGHLRSLTQFPAEARLPPAASLSPEPCGAAPGPRAKPGQPPLTQDPIAAEGQRLLPRRPRNQPRGRRGRGLTLGQPSFGQ